jgi:hypothetical protein
VIRFHVPATGSHVAALCCANMNTQQALRLASVETSTDACVHLNANFIINILSHEKLKVKKPQLKVKLN